MTPNVVDQGAADSEAGRRSHGAPCWGWQHEGREVEFVFDEDGPQTQKGWIFAIGQPSEGDVAIWVEKANGELCCLSWNGIRFISPPHSR